MRKLTHARTPRNYQVKFEKKTNKDCRYDPTLSMNNETHI
jgi:hypothetical protein